MSGSVSGAGSDCGRGSGIGSGSVSGSDSGSGSGSDGGGVECDADHGGPDCNACEEDIYGGGCVTDCDIKTKFSGHGRCRGSVSSSHFTPPWENADFILEF